MARNRKGKKPRQIKSLAERHSPPDRKEVLTKTYATPTEITQVHILRTDGK